MKCTLLGCLLTLGWSVSSWALPTEPTTVHGQVQIQSGQNLVQILQQTPQAIINWNQFNIGLGETVRFLQPSQQAAILNRVTGLDPSVIQGLLQANGRVFLLNPNGILFGPNSVVDVGSFTASTLKMSNEDFLNGTYKLTQDNSLPLAALTNQGTIKVAEGGFVVLVSPLLDNQGMILAQAGQVNLGAGTQATFSVDGRGLVQFALPDGFDPQFRGGGQGGTVLLQPGQMSQLLSQVVTNPALVEAGSFHNGANGQTLAHGAEGVLIHSGTIQAQQVRLDSTQASVLPTAGRLEGGDVRLLSAGKTVSSGHIKADFAEVSGKNLWVQGSIIANHILFDPFDITIIDAPNGGTFDTGLPNVNTGNSGAGSGSISVGAMQAQAGTVTLTADHDILYSGNGFSLGATALTLLAGNDINLQINTSGSISASALNFQAGRDVLVSVNGNGGLSAGTGALSVTGARDVRLSANADLILNSPTLAQISATNNDLTLTSAIVNSNFTTFLNGGGTYQFTAGRDLTVTNPRLLAGSSAVSLQAGNDVALQQGNGSSFQASAASFNVQAGRNFAGNSTNGNFSITTGAGGNLQLLADGSLDLSAAGSTSLSSGGALVVRSASVTAGGTNVGLTATGQTVVNATGGSLNLTATPGDVHVASSTDRTAVNATGDILLSAGGDIFLTSPTTTRVTAGNDATVRSSTVQNSFTTFVTGPDTLISAGHDLLMEQPNFRHSSGTGAVVLTAANDVRLTSRVGALTANLGSLRIQAGRDLTGQPNSGSLTLLASTGDLVLSAGRNLSLKAPNSTVALTSNQGASRVTALDIELSGRDVGVSAQGETVVNASSGSLRLSADLGDVLLNSNAGRVAANATNGDVFMTAGGDIKLQSASTTRVNATRDVDLISSTFQNSFTTFLSSPDTAIAAGRNLTMVQPNVGSQVAPGSVSLSAANDLTLTSPRQININVGSLNVQAGHDLNLQAPIGDLTVIANTGALNLGAVRNLQLNAPGRSVSLIANTSLNVTAQNVSSSGSNFGASGNGPVVINATNGSVDLLATQGDVRLNSNTGRVAVNATNGDVHMSAGGDIKLQSATTTRVDATRDVDLTASTFQASFSTFLSSPDTAISAGRNLTMSQPNLGSQAAPGAVRLNAGNDLSLGSPRQLNVNLGSLNAQAGQDMTVQALSGDMSVIANSGALNLGAVRDLQINAPGRNIGLSGNSALNVTGQSVTASGISFSATSNGPVVVNATGGSVNITADTGNLLLQSSNDRVAVNATGGDAVLAAGGDIRLQSSNNSVNATRDVKMTSGSVLTNFTTFLVGPTLIQAGRDLNLSQPNLNQSGGATVVKAGNDLTLRNDAAFLSAGLQSLDAQAGGDLRIQGASGFSLSTGQGLKLQAAGNLSFSNNGSLQNGGVSTTISGGNVALDNVGLTFNNGDVNLNSAGNLTVGSLNTNANANTTLTGANITLQSMQVISGGNYTITTPGNLTEVTPATNPPTLAGLNITAGNAFGLNAPDAAFSISRTASAGNLTGLVTGGNDTVQQASSSFRNFNGADFQPGHIDFQTGDIYVDGQLYYSGLRPVTPPPNPPTPPPTPNPPPTPPIVPPVVDIVPVVQQQQAVTPEQRTQILAQSNLALGNLGSFSRVLSETEQEHLTARQDSLHQTWSLDPFSPTLALTVPGGAPQVRASELASLAALLLMTSNQSDAEEKNRQAYNVIVDQELREIWEVRYWRHLLDGFILWEDRE